MNYEPIKHALDNGLPLTSKEAKELLDIIERLERGASTVEEITDEFAKEFAPNGFIEEDEELVVPKIQNWLRTKFTSLTKQHQREKEDIMKEILATATDIAYDSELIYVSDVRKIATNHNIHI